MVLLEMQVCQHKKKYYKERVFLFILHQLFLQLID